MLYIAHKLTQKDVTIAEKKGATIFISNELDREVEFSSNTKYVNALEYSIEGSWWHWEQNKNVFEAFKSKNPEIFKWNGNDLSLAFQKAVFWSNRNKGFLHYVYNVKFRDVPCLYVEEYYPSSFFKTLLKYVISKSKKHNTSTLELKNEAAFENPTFGILVKDRFELDLYSNIIEKLVSNRNHVVIMTDIKVYEYLNEHFKGINTVLIGNTVGNNKIKLRSIPSFIDKKTSYVFDHIINNWNFIQYWFEVSQIIVKMKIRKLLINEGENGAFGAVIGEVMKKNNILTYNTMNGTKAGEAQDAFINFDYWFVWGDKMKQKLINDCGLSEHMLLPSGHLVEEKISRYKYADSLPLDYKKLSEKPVISLFSILGNPAEKKQAFESIFKLVKNNPNIILLIRYHPYESQEHKILPPPEIENIKIVDFNHENSKETLYDQLSVSNLSICFGSTVALESKWFGVPCITYETREESLIYLTDNEMIIHVQNNEELITKTNELLSQEKRQKPKLKNVAEFIINTLETDL